MAFALAVTLAVPSDPVTALVDDKVALAPEAGAAKVTVTPLTGEPYGSESRTVSGALKALFTIADCGDPDAATSVPGANP